MNVPGDWRAAGPRRTLRALFDAAVAAADPMVCLPPHLPPPPRGRTVVVGAGKAAATMARAVEAHYPGDLTGLVVTRYGHGAPTRRIAVVEASLKRLGLDSIDLLLIHWRCPRQNLYVETWRALVRLKAEGRARSIGVSNFLVPQLERIVGETGVAPAVNQIELHPRFQQAGLRAAHARHGIVTECWTPLGGDLLADPVVVGIAQKHGRSPAQLILRWHLEAGLVAIPKTSSPTRMAENRAILDFRLDGDDQGRLAALDSASGRTGPDPETFG